MPGTGKSTISRTVAVTFPRLLGADNRPYGADNGLLGASFFFRRGEGDRGKAALFFPTIASQLMRKIPALEPYVRAAIDADPAIAKKALRDQFEKLILQLLTAFARLCRLELPIRLGFKDVQGKYQDLALHQIPERVVERDISAFLRHQLTRIRDEYNSQALEGFELLPDWPGEHVIRTLAQMAVPLFIFAATVCRFVEDPVWSDPADQLKKVLQCHQTKTHDSELDKLDATYLPVLNQLTVGRPDPQRTPLPLSVSSLARLLNISPTALSGRLNSLHSVLSIPSKADAPVRLFHLSFRDFLIDPTKRAAEFWIDETKYHKMLTDRCIQLIRQHLKRDICGLQLPGKLWSEVDRQTIDAALPPVIQYACQYWVHHLKESNGSIRDGGPVHTLLKSHLLYWLEALGLLGRISDSLGIVDDLFALLDPVDAIEVSAILRDTRHVILSCRSTIDTAPVQVSASELVFSPARSIIRNLFENEMPKWII
ncbi:hypothetical protein B0T14DRAFT_563644 [Immersiella caudata]|uniref:Nephrocystin 3-like N-terminal domain-containing protein n=1 Tax=Immersiella caudata TaxID=314043 RepID=A0AA40C7B6_9PEZI|nr:hypothetical protein B0T14DRAFT_563644 [Immersiella caudata]